MGFSDHSEHGGDRRVTHLVMAGRYLGVLVLGLCCTLPVVWGQGYVNIAPGKSYDQSSTYDSSYLSRYATDGYTHCFPRFNSKTENNPYWEVDLGRTYPVRSITLWSLSSSSTGGSMYPVNITVDDQHCVTVSSNPTGYRKHSLTCSSVLYGRRVRVTGTGTGRRLAICEIEILGVSEGEVEKLIGLVVGAITGVGLLLIVSLLVFLCWKQRSQKTGHETDKTTTSASDPVSAHNLSPLSAEPQADTQYVIRDPGNTYEHLRVYNNMVFERELPVAPEARADDVTATSGHAGISPDNIYVNTTTTTPKNVKPRSKKSK